MASFEVTFPIQVGALVAPLLDGLESVRPTTASKEHPPPFARESTCPGRCFSLLSEGWYITSARDIPLEICVPIERWIPEQRMQRKTPLGLDS